MTARHSVLLVALALLAACGGSENVPPSAATDPASAPAPAAGIGLAPAHDSAPLPGAPGEAVALHFELPTGWEQLPPSSAMRLAEVRVPGPAGPAELLVFHFGPGQGGGVEDNISRWLGQLELATGSRPERGAFESGGFRVTWIEARGTLLPSNMGSGPATPTPGQRLLGAVVEGSGGPWFFKLTGPDDTVAAAREPLLAMLRRLHRQQRA